MKLDISINQDIDVSPLTNFCEIDRFTYDEKERNSDVYYWFNADFRIWMFFFYGYNAFSNKMYLFKFDGAILDFKSGCSLVMQECDCCKFSVELSKLFRLVDDTFCVRFFDPYTSDRYKISYVVSNNYYKFTKFDDTAATKRSHDLDVFLDLIQKLELMPYKINFGY